MSVLASEFVLTEELYEKLSDNTRFPWTRESFIKVVRLYKPGVSVRKMTELTGISYNTIIRAFRIVGIYIPTSGETQQVFTCDEEDFLLRCNRKGLSITDLATLKGVTRQTISKALIRARKRKNHVQDPKSGR